MFFFGILISTVTVFGQENFAQNKTVISNGTHNEPNPAIIGGFEGVYEEFPHAARLYILKQPPQTCTTEIIHPIIVITAAHCLKEGNTKMVVVAGNNNLEEFVLGANNSNYAEYTVSETFVHPRFNPYSLKHDVALLKLEKPMSHQGLKVLPVSYDRIEGTKKATIYGWGAPPSVKNDRLFAKELQVRPCKENVNDDYEYICLMEHGVEEGDSGGPIIIDGKLRGLCSHKTSVKNEDGSETVENYLFTPLSEEKQFLEIILLKNGANDNGRFLFLIMFLTFII